MINGVLVERTIKDVKPILETNSEGLKKLLEELVKQYKKQQEEMDKWKVYHARTPKPYNAKARQKTNNIQVVQQ